MAANALSRNRTKAIIQRFLRFNLSDGTSYDLIYACYGVKNGELKSAAGGFKYFTSADIGSYWNNLNTELEAIPINESELP